MNAPGIAKDCDGQPIASAEVPCHSRGARSRSRRPSRDVGLRARNAGVTRRELSDQGASVLDIFVDADACPVKGEVERVADRHALTVYMVSNGGIRPSAHPRFHHVTVTDGPDAADDWIAERIGVFDIAVTADVPLASRCLKKNASVIGPSGKLFTAETIGMALGMRELNRHLREATGGETLHGAFTKQDRSRFLGTLENEIQALKRRIAASASRGG
jgi:uncharacterized protein YaiI (UPF0178 family)